MKTLYFTQEDIFKGYLILVNPFHPIKNDLYEKSLVPVNAEFSQHFLERETAYMLSKLMKKLGGEQYIVPVSGYRSMQEQQKIYSDTLHERGQVFTEKYVAIPGCSEHQTGLAIDLAKNSRVVDFICPYFPYTGICGRFRKFAPHYGFIERYPQGKEALTGISHEPWHFRYVGVPHAEIITQNGFTLEEYIKYLKDYSYDGKHLYVNHGNLSMELFYVPVSDCGNIKIDIPKELQYQVSGTNGDGVVVLIRRDRHGR